MNRDDLILSECPNCGGTLDIDNDALTAVCQSCGAVFEIQTSDAVKIQTAKVKAYRDVEVGKQKIERERLHHHIEREQRADEERRINDFKNGFLGKLIIAILIVCGIACAIGFISGNPLPGVIALLQVILGMVAGLIGLNVIKPQKRNLHVVLVAVSLLLVIPVSMLFISSIKSNLNDKPEKKQYTEQPPVEIDWDSLKLGKHLPKPKTTTGKIELDWSDELWVDIKPSEETQAEYYQRCKEMGYTVDRYENSVFNEEGYKLTLEYYKRGKILRIMLYPPVKLGEIEWANAGIAKKLPKLDADIGDVITEKADEYAVLVGNTSKADYDEYVRKCQKKGFDVDYEKYDRIYTAKNKKGDELELRYLGNNVIRIDISEAAQ